MSNSLDFKTVFSVCLFKALEKDGGGDVSDLVDFNDLIDIVNQSDENLIIKFIEQEKNVIRILQSLNAVPIGPYKTFSDENALI